MAATKGKRKHRRQPMLDAHLAPRWQRFVDEYLIDCNATKAAIRAGYSERTARAKACTLMAEPAVQDAVRVAMEARRVKTGITAERVLEEIRRVAMANIREVIRVDADGKVYVRDLDGMAEETTAAISEITQLTTETSASEEGESVTEKVRLGVKMHSKVAALKMLMDHLGLNAPVKQEVAVEVKSAKESLESKLDELRKRLCSTQPG